MHTACKRTRTSAAAIAIAVALLFALPLLGAPSALAQAPEGYSTVNVGYGHQGRHVTGFTYHDEMLLGDSRSFSPDVAKASAALAMAAYLEDDITSAMGPEGMDYTPLWTCNYTEKATIDNFDFVACSLHMKQVTFNGERYAIYCLPVRGTSAGAEWFGNFNLGTTGDHEGFYTAASGVLDKVEDSLSHDDYDSAHTVLWVTGHSRGAAVANIVAGKLCCDSSYAGLANVERIFAYTFACPAISRNLPADAGNLTNIYNLNNAGDLVAAMPFESWGYSRYGQTQNLETGTPAFENMKQRFQDECGAEWASELTTDSYMETLGEILPNEIAYHTPESKLFFALIAYYLGGNNDVTFREMLNYAGVKSLPQLLASSNGVASAFGKAVNLVGSGNGGSVDAIVHGHTGETYVLWVNSIYYGYEGWLGSAVARFTLPSGYDNVGYRCFYDCDSLTNVVIGDQARYIPSGAFGACDGEMSVTIPVDFLGYRPDAFGGSTVSAIRYTSGATGVMPDRADSPSGDSYYRDTLEWNCRGTLASVAFGKGVKRIGDRAFFAGSGEEPGKLSTVKWSSTLQAIGRYAFARQGALGDVVLPTGLSALGEGCFSGASGLTSVVLPASLAALPADCFAGCTGLKWIQTTASLKQMGSGCCQGVDKNAFEIYGIQRSFAETYATQNGFTFIPLGVPVLSVEGDSVPRGGSLQLEARICTAPTSFTNASSFSVAGNTSAKTKVDGSVLRVAEGELAQSVTVTAVFSGATVSKSVAVVLSEKDRESVRSVVAAITALPPVGEMDLSHAAAVTAARAGYKSLDKRQKALVSAETLDTLAAAEARIRQLQIESPLTVSAADVRFTYDGKPHGSVVVTASDPVATIRYGTREGEYTFASCPEFTDAGTYTVYIMARRPKVAVPAGVRVTTLGAASDSGADSGYEYAYATATVTIDPADLSRAVLKPTAANPNPKGVRAARYTGGPRYQSDSMYTLELDGRTLKRGVDFATAYEDNVNVGTDTAVFIIKPMQGDKNYTGELRRTFTIMGVKLDGNAKISLTASKPYAGGPVYQSASELKVTATVGGRTVTLVRGLDYSVAHSNNGKPGKATVTVTGKGNYWGKATATFTITKGANRLAASRVTDKFQASATKATVIYGSKVFKVSNPAKGAITYSKKSGPAKVSIDARTGKVTVAKGLKPGTYWTTFTVKSAATACYNAASKDVSVAFVVK